MTSLALAECALSPMRAFTYGSDLDRGQKTPRVYQKTPAEWCYFLGQNPRVKSLIWC